MCLCLQAFFCERSDYFKALLEDHFSEGGQLQSQPSTPVITLHNISHEIFIHVMYYIYSDDTEVSAQSVLSEIILWHRLSGMQTCPSVRKLNIIGLLVYQPRTHKKDDETEASTFKDQFALPDWFPTVRHLARKKEKERL